jgi:hypothetical protein
LDPWLHDYSYSAKIFVHAINNKEILISRQIIENKWNIGSLLSCYKNVDFTFTDKKPDDYKFKFLGDIMFPQFRNSL